MALKEFNVKNAYCKRVWDELKVRYADQEHFRLLALFSKLFLQLLTQCLELKKLLFLKDLLSRKESLCSVFLGQTMLENLM